MTRRQISGWVVALLLLAGGLAAQSNEPAEAAVRPTVTGVAATTGSTAGGEFVTLHGTGFNGVYVVAFGGVKTRNFHVWSSTEITVRVPKHGAGRVYVRVARPGAASVFTARATYTYAATPRGLALQGTSQEAPAVTTFTFDVIEPNLALDCATSTFCAAVGDLGAATWNGTSWSAVTPFGSGNTQVLLSCPVGGFCLAYSSDDHTWRYSNGAWTDLGAFPGLDELDCGGAALCGGVVGDQAVLFDGTTWGVPTTLFDSGVAGISCPHQTRCVANSFSGFYRTWAETWGSSRPMWNTATLRNSSITQGVTGGLECSTVNFCLSSGGLFIEGRTPRYRMAFFTGSTWSPAREVLATVDEIRIDVDCAANNFCLHRVKGRDFLGDAYRNYRIFNGTARSSSTASFRAGSQNDIACWAPYQCIGIGFRTWTRVGAA